MKKLCLMLTACIFVLVGVGADMPKNLKEWEVIVLGDTCIAALKTEPMFSKDEYRLLESAVSALVEEQFPAVKNIYISYDLDIFLKTAALKKQIDKAGNTFSFAEQIFDLIKVIEARKGVLEKGFL